MGFFPLRGFPRYGLFAATFQPSPCHSFDLTVADFSLLWPLFSPFPVSIYSSPSHHGGAMVEPLCLKMRRRRRDTEIPAVFFNV